MQVSGWIRALARALHAQLDTTANHLLDETELHTLGNQSEKHIECLGLKLDGLAKLLKLYPYSSRGKYTGKLKSISHEDIKPAIAICPESVTCLNQDCKS